MIYVMIYVRILVPAYVIGFCGAIFGSVWIAFAGHEAAISLYSFIGACTGMVVGAVVGATQCLIAELPGAIKKAINSGSQADR